MLLKSAYWKRNWHIIVTCAYFGFFLGLFWRHTSSGIVLELNELGDFLAGTAGPIAFFWLVIGYYQQNKELQLSSDALKVQAEELKKATVQQSQLADLTRQQLAQQKLEFEHTLASVKSSRTPKFVFTYEGYDRPQPEFLGDTPSDVCTHRFSLANIGGTACRVSLWVAYGALEPDDERTVIWPQFNVKEYTLSLYASDAHGDAIQMCIDYEDSDGERHRKEFYFTRTRHLDPSSFELSEN